MKNKQKKKEFDSDFENTEINEEIAQEDLADASLTKAQRKMIRNAKKKGEDRSKLENYDKSDVAEAKRYAKTHKFKVIFVTLTIVLLLTVLTTLIVFAVIQRQNGPSHEDYRIFIGNDTFEDKEPAYEIDYKEANRYGQLYFDIKSIAKYADIKIGGEAVEKGSLKFICKDSTWVEFTDGSSIAVINGSPVEIGGVVHIISDTKDEESKCLVPFTFVQQLFSHKADGYAEPGLGIILKDDNRILIGKITSRGENPPISFSSQGFTPAPDDYFAALSIDYVDSATASALKASRLELVNKTYRLEEEEVTTNGLISLKDEGCPTYTNSTLANSDFFDPIAALALIAMLTEANETLEGDDKILVSSAYRSYSYQKGLHEKYLKNYMIEHGVSEAEARKQINLFSAPAGASEHHTGLCVDVVDEAHKDSELSQQFEYRPAFEWLSENAHKYGFILRYPKDKIDITTYDYEPWHYRFVGVYAATYMYENDLTLEEFLGKVN